MDDGLSESIWFRTMTRRDVPLVHELHGDPLTNEHTPLGDSPNYPMSSAMLDKWLQHQTDHGFGYELAFQGNRLVGICGARRDLWQGRQVINLYWRLLPEYWGKGLASVLGLHALDIARSATRSAEELIVARMRPDNTSSVRVAENLGLTRRFDLDGELCGVCWILLATNGTSDRSRPVPPQL